MASRQMVGQRKGSPTPGGDERIADAGPDGEQADDSDVVECPNCACQFDEKTGDVVKEGAQVEGGKPDYTGNQGPDLDAAGSAQPVPGKLGTAHDAAMGDAVIASLLGGAGHGVGNPRVR